MSDQSELHLPRRETNDVLREQLADLVEQANCEQEPAKCAELLERIRKLRLILGVPQ